MLSGSSAQAHNQFSRGPWKRSDSRARSGLPASTRASKPPIVQDAVEPACIDATRFSYGRYLIVRLTYRPRRKRLEQNLMQHIMLSGQPFRTKDFPAQAGPGAANPLLTPPTSKIAKSLRLYGTCSVSLE
jgi:hypothetical protein